MMIYFPHSTWVFFNVPDVVLWRLLTTGLPHLPPPVSLYSGVFFYLFCVNNRNCLVLLCFYVGCKWICKIDFQCRAVGSRHGRDGDLFLLCELGGEQKRYSEYIRVNTQYVYSEYKFVESTYILLASSRVQYSGARVCMHVHTYMY